MSVRFIFIITLFTAVVVRGSRLLLQLFALDLQASPLTVGLLSATFSLLPMLIAYQVGRLSDRFGSRWPLSLGITGGSLGILIPFFFPTLPALFTAAILNGLALAFFSVTLHQVVGQMSAPQDRTSNFGTFTIMVSVAALVSPLVVGFSIDGQGYTATCLYLFSIGLLPVLMLIARGSRLPGPTVGKAHAPSGGMRKVLADPRVVRVLAINSVHQTGLEMFNFYIPVYTHGIGLSATGIGIIVSLSAAAGFIVRLALGMLLKRYTAETVLSVAMFIGAAVFMLMPLTTNLILLGTLSFLFGFAMNVGQPIILSLSYSNAPDGRSGETLGLRQTVSHAIRSTAPVLFGWLAGFGAIAVFAAGAAMLIAGGSVARRGNFGELDK